MSRKTARSDDISQVNLIDWWKELATVTNSETSLIGMFHNENMSSINLFQTRGLAGICVFSIKLIKLVVSLRYDSCVVAIGCKSESTKLEIRSVGPLLSETIGLPSGVFFL